MPQTPEVMSTRQLSAYIGIARSQVLMYRKTENLPFFRIGKLVRYRKADIDAWLEGMKTTDAKELEAKEAVGT